MYKLTQVMPIIHSSAFVRNFKLPSIFCLPFLFVIPIVILLSGCYGFKGISIPPDINTFYVENFENRASNAPANIDQVFSEALRTKIRNESKLQLTNTAEEADIIFNGNISRFQVTSEAPQEGNTVAFNKLTIAVQVEYINAKDEEENWEKSFSFFRDFDANADFQAEQDGYIEEIFDQITENLFNEAFTDW